MKYVVKLGGSLITRKDVAYFPTRIEDIIEKGKDYIKFDNIKRVLGEISEIKQLGSHEFILINGVGPFGHYLVEHKEELEYLEVIHESVEYLNGVIHDYAESLLNFGMEIVPIAPFETCYYEGNGIYKINKLWEKCKEVLHQGKVPSVYGDIISTASNVVGEKLGIYEILSGDDSGAMLAELWNADKVFWVLDVDGVFTKNPVLNKDAKQIKRIRWNDSLENFMFESVGVDVTGSIKRKIEISQNLASKGIKSQMLSGMIENNLKNALIRNESIGTLIV